MFRAYQESGDASKATTNNMVFSLRALQESINQLSGKGLEEAAVRAAAAAQDVKDELEKKPIEAKIKAAEGSGKIVRDQTQEQLFSEQPVVVQVGIQLATQLWGDDPVPSQVGDQSDIERESAKRGFRL